MLCPLLNAPIADHMNLPPRSSVLLPVVTDAVACGEVLLEGNVQLLLGRGIGVARGVTELQDGRTVVLVTNFQQEAQHLTKGAAGKHVKELRNAAEIDAITDELSPPQPRVQTKVFRVWQPQESAWSRSLDTRPPPQEFLNIMFITAAVFTVTGAVVAVRSAFGSEPEDSWALPLEEDLQASRKRIYCFFNSSAHRRPEPMTFSVAHINVDYCDDIVYTYLGVDSMAANIVSKRGASHVALLSSVVCRSTFPISAAASRGDLPGFVSIGNVSLVIWAALGGSGADSEALRKMAAQRRYRVEFADNAARWLQQYGYDGLVLHWRQPMAGQDRGMLSALVRTLKRRLAEDALRLGIVLPADKERRTAGYDVREVAQVADVLFVDTHRTMDPASFPVTSFFSPLRAKSQAKKLRQTGLSYVLGDLSLEVAQMDKLVFSLTLAGASFTLKAAENNKVGDPAAGPGHPGVFTKQPGLVSYYEIEQMLAHDLSWSRQFDRVSQCPFIVNGDQWIGFEDDVSLQSKAHLLLFTGGMALWDICMDDFRATFGRPLLARARDILLRNHSYGRSGRIKRRH
ncbi:hypothetical protein HPB47_020474 [Ixodes persulcatus]|uniref:Uncharacterized protein n=1 Tax=Ixodes persulcatus TaxID=34615 RepID=A0AC60QIV1_IXOPE|nr:hypothetical protein HPB47_020474 [Ixodes persulcatus]